MTNNRHDRIYPLMLLAAVVTLALIPVHQWLPDRRLTLWPDDSLGRDIIFSDGQRGGNSSVRWGDAPGEFICQIREGPVWKICGLHIPIGDGREQGRDLSAYTHVVLDLAYEGPTDKLRFYIRNFEPGFSDPGDYESNKFSNVIIPAEDLPTPWRASLELFTVADWWKHDNEVPLEHTMPGFDWAIMFGIDLAFPSVGRHRIKLNRVELTGPLVSQAHWYQLILGLWVAILVGLALRRYWLISARLKADEHRLASLKSYSKALKSKSERYRQLSQHDQLTGVLNRYGLERSIARLYPNDQNLGQCTILLMDLDHFKAVNDDLGHQRGDELLCELCRKIGANVREQDTFGRWGGEEFILICPDTQPANAAALAEKLRQCVNDIAVSESPPRHLSISIGVTGSQAGEAFEQTFRRADNALYQAKGQGRNTVAML